MFIISVTDIETLSQNFHETRMVKHNKTDRRGGKRIPKLPKAAQFCSSAPHFSCFPATQITGVAKLATLVALLYEFFQSPALSLQSHTYSVSCPVWVQHLLDCRGLHWELGWSNAWSHTPAEPAPHVAGIHAPPALLPSLKALAVGKSRCSVSP